jgi:hypothetical protein
VVPVRECNRASLSARLLALPLGALSGLLIATFVSVVTGGQPSPGHLTPSWFVAFGLGWAVSAFFIAQRARRLSTVVTRAAFVGTAEWLMLFFARAPAAASAAENSLAATRRYEAWHARVELLTGPFALTMAAACLLVLLLAVRLGREWEVGGEA